MLCVAPLINCGLLLANQKLIQMAAELEMAQEHARRFQETLAVERRKQKGLAVSSANLKYYWFLLRLMSHTLSISSML